jgi:hypothetical protein
MTAHRSQRFAGIPRPRLQRGLALIGVVGLLLVFLIFAGAMMDQLALEMNSVRTSAASNLALQAADAGVHAMVGEIQSDLAANLPVPGPASPLVYAYPEPGSSPQAISYTATLDATWPAGGLNYYMITSTGFYSNGVQSASRRVRAIVRSQPIGGYASFSNYEVNQFGHPVWYTSQQQFNGPVYSGGPMNIAYATPGPGGSPRPIFLDNVQTANNPNWFPGAPSGGSWADVVAGGAANFAVDPVPLGLPQPNQNVYVASEAWEGDGLGGIATPAPGVYIDGATSGGKDAATTTAGTVNTGIYIDVGTTSTRTGTATITSTVSGNTETMVISGPWSGGPYKVVINYTNFAGTGDCSGTTTVIHGSNSHTFMGTPCGAPGPGVTNTGNGAVFVAGNINFGNGSQPDTTLEGDFSFVTPDYAGWADSITINGNLRYDAASAAYDKIGLWANDVLLNTLQSNVEVDAGIIAGYPGETWRDGHFANVRCNSVGCGTLNQGTLTIRGSLVENARGAVGVLIGSSQFGFARVINFDSRFATSPPPFDPTTGALSIVAWQDLGT